jgi:uroporphyrinogen III methyltransferase/synthase
LLVDQAMTGARVVRLKGGDPFIFGRGGEEIETLVKAGIEFEVVPGVTSAIAAPAYAGIPLTHRQFTSTVAFITGHEAPGKHQSSIDWQALSRGIGTLVFLMGVRNLAHIVTSLRAHGKDAGTPVAVVRWGTTARQQTVAGTLENIEQRVKQAGLKAPAIIVVGEVVGLREQMRWFEKRPLLGKRIVVTRARQQASDLVRRLRDLGAWCMECPVIKIVPPQDIAPLNRAIENLSQFDWIVFTSVNGVTRFFDHLFARGKDVRALHRMQTAVIGPATAERLKAYGLNSDLTPDSYQAESVAAAFTRHAMKGRQVLLPRALEARSVIPDELAKQGAVVTDIAVYQTVQDRQNAEQLLAALTAREIDMVTFTSSSTVKNFQALLPPETAGALMQDVAVASIGPITSDTALAGGIDVDVTAGTFTIDGLCDAIVNYFQKDQELSAEN